MKIKIDMNFITEDVLTKLNACKKRKRMVD